MAEFQLFYRNGASKVILKQKRDSNHDENSEACENLEQYPGFD